VISKKQSIKKLTIKGFKSIRVMEDLALGNLNLLIGANGVGKSNFVSYFKMLGELVEGRLQVWSAKQGGADRILTYGVKETPRLASTVSFGVNKYHFVLEPTAESKFTFTKEEVFFDESAAELKAVTFMPGHFESSLKEVVDKADEKEKDQFDLLYASISSWKIFHFQDTSDAAGVKRIGSLHDHETLRSDASNLAAYLYYLKMDHSEIYAQIRKTVALAIPFFDDFVLKPTVLDSEEEQIRLLWRQKKSDYALWPSQLSDGSIRFICLTTALLQPNPPSTLIIDEPELGLHPYAIVLLGSLIRAASARMQLIISTQSISLLNEFSLNDLIVVEREKGASVFKRLKEDDFKVWLEEYSVGELWEKNILGGRPCS